MRISDWSSDVCSSDLRQVEALGANLTLDPEQVAECIQATGIGFMFAPAHHSAMKNVAAVRKELGVRPIFNILGPLDRTSVVQGKRVSVRVDLGGRRLFNKRTLQSLAICGAIQR